MDVSRRYYVYLFGFFGIFLAEIVFSCEVTLESERTECGNSVSSADTCPTTCCYDDSTTPKCYFREKDYGSIRHSNGLCINVKSDLNTLVWSRDCTSRNAFFLVSYDHPPFHLASGKCVLPPAKFDNPEYFANLVLSRSKQHCNSQIVTFRSTTNGNLKYIYNKNPYEICIGGKSIQEPHENENIFIQRSVCETNNMCNFSYVYERMFRENERASFHCASCSTIEIIQANYGVKIVERYPLAISSSDASCVTIAATKVVKDKCDRRERCSFVVNQNDFLQTPCLKSTILLVRYTCKWKIPAAPSALNVTVEDRNVLLIVWSNDNNNGKLIRFKISWKIVGETFVRSVTGYYKERTESKRLIGLQEATAYEITVARYSDDGKTVGRKRHKIAITRSAALKNTGKKSATSFEIQLRTLQKDDKYIQIVVVKTNRKPTKHPGNDLQPYDKNTVNSKPYIAAELGKTFVNQNSLFTVGDDKSYSKTRRTRRDISFKNVKLEPDTGYSVFQRTFKSADLYYDSDWMDVVTTDKELITKQSSTPSIKSPTAAMINTEKSTNTDNENYNKSCKASCSKMDGGTEWYLYIVTFVSGAFVGVVFSGIAGLFFYRRLKNKISAKSLQESKPESRPERNPVYEDLNLNEMNSGDDNYHQSLQGHSDSHEVSGENADSAYSELSTIREEDNNYQL
ncbi:uncharacterized protein LOC114525351 [Dendronephthya gigantea]|uniref:uncharacterized protein LOC114525351 n=1 Tax=Dendronephthya gigantea TaxID=151771 RepID=UPI00106D7006|nr:uncharacterized protein LOC114525351 [Dendronephthya gigantea]